MSGIQSVRRLVERFSEHFDDYTNSNYKEQQVCQDFIDPLFKALGWDMANKESNAERYRDVIQQPSLDDEEGSKRAPDYAFRVGGETVFYVEAKKPSIGINDNKDAAYQLRSYGWSRQLPLSILCNFEEFSVYDTRIKPLPTDKAGTARIFYCKFGEYTEKWNEIACLFSKTAVWKGALDKFAKDVKGKKGTITVDDDFVQVVDEWRENLARNIALNNKITEQELNYAVTKTINRIMFLRIAEDRGIGRYGKLKSHLAGDRIYKGLLAEFLEADDFYDSGLFHFKKEKNVSEEPDNITSKLKIDDKILKKIIESLYYPKCQYAFSVMPVEVIGHVYEQFLGKVIRLTPSGKAKVEEKPEVKKAHGVYYTPKYIVDYIVKNTVGKLCEGKKLEEVSKLSVLDPACGSGTFLLGAFQYLIDWHRNFYAKQPLKYKKQIYRDKNGEWQLTSNGKKRILLNNIFGVDIDSNAVEVAKLSLYLQVLEGESEESLRADLDLAHHEHALPSLGNNIKCGNSLIGSDYFENNPYANGDEFAKINPFDWDGDDGFPQIMQSGGFDMVIGNPPWGAVIAKSERNYLTKRFPQAADYESSQYFILKSLSYILTEAGWFGMILPNTFALNVNSKKCRDKVLDYAPLKEILDLSDIDVFLGPNVRSLVLIQNGNEKTGECNISRLKGSTEIIQQVRLAQNRQLKKAETWKCFLEANSKLSRLIRKLIKRNKFLEDYCDVRQGYIPYRTTTLTKRYGLKRAKEIVKKRIWHSKKCKGKNYLKELQGENIGRYILNWSGIWVKYGEWVSTYLPLSAFSGPRLIVREIAGKAPYSIIATYTNKVFVHNPSILAVLPKTRKGSNSLYWTLGILNSRLMSAIFDNVSPKSKKGLFPKIIITDAKRLPFPKFNEKNTACRKLIICVKRILHLHNTLAKTKMEHDRTLVKRQLNATQKSIDQLVYKLYNLSEEEIRLVEGVNVTMKPEAETPKTGAKKRKRATREVIEERTAQPAREAVRRRLINKGRE